MFELGEWLENYLEPGITSKEYMELGYQGIPHQLMPERNRPGKKANL